MTTNKDLEEMLGRSLEDGQESRRLLIARASAAEGGSCGDAASHSGKDTEFIARIAMEKIVNRVAPMLASLERALAGSEVIESDKPAKKRRASSVEKALAGSELMEIVKEYIRSREKSVEERTLQTHLASLPDAERRTAVAFFVEDARVSCAYEGIELNADGLASRLEAAIERPRKSLSKE